MPRFVIRLGVTSGLTMAWLAAVVMSLSARLSPPVAAQAIGLPAAPATVSQAPAFTIALSLVVDGLSSPVSIANAGDGSERLFVLEQAGYVRVIQQGVLLDTPYLTLTRQVACCGERGLLGLAFDPDFATNGTFYLNYTTNDADHYGATVIARYQVSHPSADVAQVLTVTHLLTIEQPQSNHNGGNLLFGPNDLYLYIGMGDGGNYGDIGTGHAPEGNGQSPGTLLGKMLRINVRGVPTYTIPPSNPFTQTAGYRPEIWALGLRNPWRFSFDSATGDMYIGDVGQNCWEEIDYQPASSSGGENYGWRIMEGFRLFDPNDRFNCDQPPITPITLTLPITAYGRSLGTVTTGGYVYRGQQYPWLRGVYFYSDSGSGRIWAIEQISLGVWSGSEKINTPYGITAFGEDENGELYVTDYSGGAIYQITSPSPIDFSASTKQISKATARPGEEVTYTIVLRNTGVVFSNTVRLTDTIPAALAYLPGSLQATRGTVDAAAAPLLKWNGVMSNTSIVTITYRAVVVATTDQLVMNTVTINPALNPPLSRSAVVHIFSPDLSTSFKHASQAAVHSGERVTYTIVLRNLGSPFTSTVRVTDVVPNGLNFIPGSLKASSGAANASSAPTLKWSGSFSPTTIVTLTYAAIASTTATRAITNNAVIAPGYTAPFTRSATIVVNGWRAYLPIALKN